MKKTLLFTSIIAGGAALSSAAYAGNNLESIFFKPASGAIVSDTTYTDASSEYKANGTTTDTDDTIITETVSYGVNDRLSVDVSLSQIDREATNSADTNKDESDGLTNPEITLNYRTANQKQDGFFSDIRVSFAPDAFKRELADNTTSKGTVAAGGNVYGAGVSYGRKTDIVDYQLNIGTTYNEDSELDNLTGTVTTDEARTDFSYGIDLQYSVNDQITVDGNATRTVRGTYTDSAGNTNVGGNELALTVGANYAIDGDKIVSISYTDVDIADSTTDGNSRIAAESSNVRIGFKYRF